MRDPLRGTGAPLPSGDRPVPGPVAVLPGGAAHLVAAVEAGGGTVAPLGPDTAGIIWAHPSDPAGLEAVLAEHPDLGWVQLPWAGVDAFAGVLAAHAGRRFPIWTSAKGAYSEPVAEHAVTLALACLRELPEKARRTSWSARSGESIFGRRVLIIGAGGIAQEIIRLLQPFDTSITIVRRSPGEVPGADRVVTVDRLDEVLPEAEIVILAAAATGETKHLFDAHRIGLMAPDAVLVNIARGSLVDTTALAEALHRGHLAGAGIDVTDPEPLPDGHPLWTAPRVVITCHSADTDEMVAPLLASRVESNVRALLGDGAFIGVVDPRAGY
ncbi:MAG: hydroxyacid dehydrogenase [Microbacteriaceae bacterium]|nr:hydroxyacid dehydrogenase [Microbacteriaceae bacterium]